MSSALASPPSVAAVAVTCIGAVASAAIRSGASRAAEKAALAELWQRICNMCAGEHDHEPKKSFARLCRQRSGRVDAPHAVYPLFANPKKIEWELQVTP